MRWDIIIVSYDGTEKYRACRFNEDNVITKEQTFENKIEAEVYIAYEQKQEQNESV
jgi:hypothetical protein